MLLSGALGKSIDELVGNDIAHSSKEEPACTKLMEKIYCSFILLCGTIAGIWAFSANRFRPGEILGIIAAGMLIGFCLSALYTNTLKYLRNNGKGKP